MKLNKIISDLCHIGDVGKAVEASAELTEALEQLLTSHKDEINKLTDTFNSRISELKAERDALATQIEQLSILCLAYEDKLPFPVMTQELFNPIFKARTLLAEIKAEAVHDFVTFLPTYAYDINIRLRNEANKFEAKVRQGEQGTWLKNSNVNGGKRQGDE